MTDLEKGLMKDVSHPSRVCGLKLMDSFNDKLPIVNKGITLTEIPNRISVFFEIGNCTCHCDGCHSPELWDTNYTRPNMTVQEMIDYVHEQYKLGANAVVIMGGWNNEEVSRSALILLLLDLSCEFQVGIYVGDDYLGCLPRLPIKWIKSGRYEKDKGGLDSPTTNQKFYEFNSYYQTWEDKTKEYFQKGDSDE
ncbi:4Fe-4S cluster-binding domain-containing protein [Megasphaera elsdenii]|uniref:4Fe-4S cluster-binding domain-containing protein n=1 Tax=Megasphaera elsdenii TaxID=907 RepID=UPI00195BFF4E|nr:4Fe-4S cluster-binding domain-containing protein [Megasphaera elsdenii]MBM6701110.1 4Fe-4S cluster-binding domain-containing protein [Megasphaera elsdenii]